MNNRNNNKKPNSSMNTYADNMIERILNCIRVENKKLTRVDTAIVKFVNVDGTVDVYFPPDETQVFTRISNQTPFELNEGDGVEILLKNGSYSNCWIIAKHGVTYQKND